MTKLVERLLAAQRPVLHQPDEAQEARVLLGQRPVYPADLPGRRFGFDPPGTPWETADFALADTFPTRGGGDDRYVNQFVIALRRRRFE